MGDIIKLRGHPKAIIPNHTLRDVCIRHNMIDIWTIRSEEANA